MDSKKGMQSNEALQAKIRAAKAKLACNNRRRSPLNFREVEAEVYGLDDTEPFKLKDSPDKDHRIRIAKEKFRVQWKMGMLAAKNNIIMPTDGSTLKLLYGTEKGRANSSHPMLPTEKQRLNISNAFSQSSWHPSNSKKFNASSLFGEEEEGFENAGTLEQKKKEYSEKIFGQKRESVLIQLKEQIAGRQERSARAPYRHPQSKAIDPKERLYSIDAQTETHPELFDLPEGPNINYNPPSASLLHNPVASSNISKYSPDYYKEANIETQPYQKEFSNIFVGSIGKSQNPDSKPAQRNFSPRGLDAAWNGSFPDDKKLISPIYKENPTKPFGVPEVIRTTEDIPFEQPQKTVIPGITDSPKIKAEFFSDINPIEKVDKVASPRTFLNEANHPPGGVDPAYREKKGGMTLRNTESRFKREWEGKPTMIKPQNEEDKRETELYRKQKSLDDRPVVEAQSVKAADWDKKYQPVFQNFQESSLNLEKSQPNEEEKSGSGRFSREKQNRLDQPSLEHNIGSKIVPEYLDNKPLFVDSTEGNQYRSPKASAKPKTFLSGNTESIRPITNPTNPFPQEKSSGIPTVSSPRTYAPYVPLLPLEEKSEAVPFRREPSPQSQLRSSSPKEQELIGNEQRLAEKTYHISPKERFSPSSTNPMEKGYYKMKDQKDEEDPRIYFSEKSNVVGKETPKVPNLQEEQKAVPYSAKMQSESVPYFGDAPEPVRTQQYSSNPEETSDPENVISEEFQKEKKISKEIKQEPTKRQTDTFLHYEPLTQYQQKEIKHVPTKRQSATIVDDQLPKQYKLEENEHEQTKYHPGTALHDQLPKKYQQEEIKHEPTEPQSATALKDQITKEHQSEDRMKPLIEPEGKSEAKGPTQQYHQSGYPQNISGTSDTNPVKKESIPPYSNSQIETLQEPHLSEKTRKENSPREKVYTSPSGTSQPLFEEHKATTPHDEISNKEEKSGILPDSKSPKRIQENPDNIEIYEATHKEIPKNEEEKSYIPLNPVASPKMSQYPKEEAKFSPNAITPHDKDISPLEKAGSPYRRDESPHSKDKSPHIKHESPLNEDESSYKKEESSYKKEESPPNKEKSLYRRDESPPNKEESPYRRDESPHNKNESSYRRDESPPNKDESPHIKNESPLNKNESSYRRDESPPNKDESPYRRDKTPHSKTESPHIKNESPLNEDESSYKKEESPHNKDESLHNKAEIPYNKDESPHSKVISPHKKDKTPHSKDEKINISQPSNLQPIISQYPEEKSTSSIDPTLQHYPKEKAISPDISQHPEEKSAPTLLPLSTAQPTSRKIPSESPTNVEVIPDQKNANSPPQQIIEKSVHPTNSDDTSNPVISKIENSKELPEKPQTEIKQISESPVSLPLGVAQENFLSLSSDPRKQSSPKENIQASERKDLPSTTEPISLIDPTISKSPLEKVPDTIPEKYYQDSFPKQSPTSEAKPQNMLQQEKTETEFSRRKKNEEEKDSVINLTDVPQTRISDEKIIEPKTDQYATNQEKNNLEQKVTDENSLETKIPERLDFDEPSKESIFTEKVAASNPVPSELVKARESQTEEIYKSNKIISEQLFFYKISGVCKTKLKELLQELIRFQNSLKDSNYKLSSLAKIVRRKMSEHFSGFLFNALPTVTKEEALSKALINIEKKQNLKRVMIGLYKLQHSCDMAKTEKKSSQDFKRMKALSQVSSLLCLKLRNLYLPFNTIHNEIEKEKIESQSQILLNEKAARKKYSPRESGILILKSIVSRKLIPPIHSLLKAPEVKLKFREDSHKSGLQALKTLILQKLNQRFLPLSQGLQEKQNKPNIGSVNLHAFIQKTLRRHFSHICNTTAPKDKSFCFLIKSIILRKIKEHFQIVTQPEPEIDSSKLKIFNTLLQNKIRAQFEIMKEGIVEIRQEKTNREKATNKVKIVLASRLVKHLHELNQESHSLQYNRIEQKNKANIATEILYKFLTKKLTFNLQELVQTSYNKQMNLAQFDSGTLRLKGILQRKLLNTLHVLNGVSKDNTLKSVMKQASKDSGAQMLKSIIQKRFYQLFSGLMEKATQKEKSFAVMRLLSMNKKISNTKMKNILQLHLQNSFHHFLSMIDNSVNAQKCSVLTNNVKSADMERGTVLIKNLCLLNLKQQFIEVQKFAMFDPRKKQKKAVEKMCKIMINAASRRVEQTFLNISTSISNRDRIKALLKQFVVSKELRSMKPFLQRWMARLKQYKSRMMKVASGTSLFRRTYTKINKKTKIITLAKLRAFVQFKKQVISRLTRACHILSRLLNQKRKARLALRKWRKLRQQRVASMLKHLSKMIKK